MFILWISFSLVTVAKTEQEYLKTILGKNLRAVQFTSSLEHSQLLNYAVH